MRSAEAVSMELGRMIARNYPELHVNCAQCERPIAENAPCVILVTVAKNPELAPMAHGKFVGYDAALCSGTCLRLWASSVKDGDRIESHGFVEEETNGTR